MVFLNFFRAVSALEGISYLVILSVTAGIISRDYVFALGMTHGALFLIYMFASLQTSHKRGWSVFVWLLIFLAAVVPFAFIAVELFLRKEMEQRELSAT
jgi:integral membrane protein